MVKIVQLRCPARHCLLAIAYEDGAETLASACNKLREVMVAMKMNEYCGICGSREIVFEEGNTSFATMYDAAPHLAACSLAQRATREHLDGASRTFDQNRKN